MKTKQTQELVWTDKPPKGEGWYWWWPSGLFPGLGYYPTIVYLHYAIRWGEKQLAIQTNHKATTLCPTWIGHIETKNDLWAGPLLFPNLPVTTCPANGDSPGIKYHIKFI